MRRADRGILERVDQLRVAEAHAGAGGERTLIEAGAQGEHRVRLELEPEMEPRREPARLLHVEAREHAHRTERRLDREPHAQRRGIRHALLIEADGGLDHVRQCHAEPHPARPRRVETECQARLHVHAQVRAHTVARPPGDILAAQLERAPRPQAPIARA